MPETRRNLAARDLVRFAAVGCTGLLVDIGVFNLLRTTVLPDGRVGGAALVAKAIAATLAIVTNWAGNRWWTFRGRRQTRMLPELLSFVAVSLAGSAIAVLCLAVSHFVLGLTSSLADNLSANGVGLILGSMFRFAATRAWVFRDHPIPADVVI
jgi:putative flippase GtrA